jgi:hypothetical protein
MPVSHSAHADNPNTISYWNLGSSFLKCRFNMHDFCADDRRFTSSSGSAVRCLIQRDQFRFSLQLLRLVCVCNICTVIALALVCGKRRGHVRSQYLLCIICHVCKLRFVLHYAIIQYVFHSGCMLKSRGSPVHDVDCGSYFYTTSLNPQRMHITFPSIPCTKLWLLNMPDNDCVQSV